MKRFSYLLATAATLVASAASAQENPDDFRNFAKPKAAPKPDVVQPNPPQPGPQPTTPVPTTQPKTWELAPFGYLRAGLDWTLKDDRYTFIGRNNGFVLDSARVGLDGHSAEEWHVAFRVSIEGASDELSNPNTPIGNLSVRLRDGFARWDPIPFIGIQAGQFKAPWQEEELRGTNTLLFASRAVGVEGVLPGRGFQTPGLQLDRQIGVMLSPSAPIGSEAVAVSYYLMLMNGNGSNQLLDDNGKFGVVGRAELGIYEYVRLGAGVYHNDRTVGEPPNLYSESDTGLTGDLSAKIGGLQAMAAVTQVRTVFPTVNVAARVQLAFHGQAGYKFEFANWHIGPAYRYAYFHPWQSGGADGFDAYRVQYHTAGLRAGLTKVPLQAWLNYTLAQEGEGRKLDNDRIELMGQVTF
jgi:hypothetical protein